MSVQANPSITYYLANVRNYLLFRNATICLQDFEDRVGHIRQVLRVPWDIDTMGLVSLSAIRTLVVRIHCVGVAEWLTVRLVARLGGVGWKETKEDLLEKLKGSAYRQIPRLLKEIRFKYQVTFFECL